MCTKTTSGSEVALKDCSVIGVAPVSTDMRSCGRIGAIHTLCGNHFDSSGDIGMS